MIIDGSGSWDPDSDPLHYQWDLQSGDGTLLGTESDLVELTLPDLPVSFGSTSTASVDVSLTVYDCREADDDVVTIIFVCESS